MNKFKYILNDFVIKHSKLSIIVIYNVIIVGMCALFYYILPLLMGYPPNANSVSNAIGTSNLMQYCFVSVATVIIATTVLWILLKNIEKAGKLSPEHAEDVELLNKIRKQCINTPYIIYFFQICLLNIPFILMAIIIHIVAKTPILMILKVLFVVCAFLSMAAIISYTFSKRIFTQILFRIYNGETKAQGIRISLRAKLFMQIIPLLVVAILFTGLIGYSRLINEKGDMAYMVCNDLLEDNYNLVQATSIDQIFESFESHNFPEGIKISYFVVDSKGKFFSSEGYMPTAFFSYYVKHPIGLEKDRVYGDTNEVQGVIKEINGKLGNIKVGIKYELASPKTVYFFIIILLIVLSLCILVLYYFSKAFSEEISLVSKSLCEIAEGENLDPNKKIPITSNDEVSDLVIAYNKIRDRQLEYDRLKNEFIANVSHELRTPLNVILATIQLSEVYMNNNLDEFLEKSSKNIKTVKQNSLRLLRLVNNLIDINKIEAGYLQLYLQKIDIVKLIKDITSSVGSFAKAKNVSLQFYTEVKKKMIYCDIDAVERIMLNLLSNAIKFTKPDGNVDVSIRDSGENVMISVKDTGIGIASEKHKIIFQRFTQADQSLTRSYEGSGIGLSLVKSLVELLKGKIHLESEVGVGSEFAIELPAKEVLDDETIQAKYKERAIKNDILRRVNVELSDISI